MSEDMGLVTPLAAPSVVSRELANEPATPSGRGMITKDWQRRSLAIRRERRALRALGYRCHETDWEIHRGYRCDEVILDAKISLDGKYVWTKLGKPPAEGRATNHESTREGTKGVSPDPTEPNTSQHLIDRGRVEP